MPPTQLAYILNAATCLTSKGHLRASGIKHRRENIHNCQLCLELITFYKFTKMRVVCQKNFIK